MCAYVCVKDGEKGRFTSVHVCFCVYVILRARIRLCACVLISLCLCTLLIESWRISASCALLGVVSCGIIEHPAWVFDALCRACLC